MPLILNQIVNLLFALAAGAVVGFFNILAGRKGHMRLFALICCGAALTAQVSNYLFILIGLPWTADPGRISAQVVSAVGFLGVGLIYLVDRFTVKGLSTAATMWLTAILGLMIGIGKIKLAFITLIIVLIIDRIYTRLIIRLRKKE